MVLLFWTQVPMFRPNDKLKFRVVLPCFFHPVCQLTVWTNSSLTQAQGGLVLLLLQPVRVRLGIFPEAQQNYLGQKCWPTHSFTF